jgi:hypothetical protein
MARLEWSFLLSWHLLVKDKHELLLYEFLYLRVYCCFPYRRDHATHIENDACPNKKKD